MLSTLVLAKARTTNVIAEPNQHRIRSRKLTMRKADHAKFDARKHFWALINQKWRRRLAKRCNDID